MEHKIAYVVHPDFDGLRWADSADVQLTTCADGTLCCGNYSTALPCCKSGKGYLIQQGKVIKAEDAMTSSTSTAAPSAPQSSSSSISPNSTSMASIIATPPPASKPSDTGAIVGGVVGGVAGIAALALALWYFMIRRKFILSQIDNPDISGQRQFDKPQEWGRQQEVWQEPKEVPTDVIRRELEATHIQHEIGDRRSTDT